MGKYNSDIHHRGSIRLKDYDYAAAGAYFITLCAEGRYNLFGEIVGGEMLLNDLGVIVEEEWLRTPGVRHNVVLDAHVVMPNHLHGIVLIDDDRTGLSHEPVARPGRMQYAPTLRSPAQTIGAIVRGYKAAVTRRIGALCGTPDVRVWQRNFYEHVIRGDNDLDRIRAYIVNNPARWAEDDYNPERAS